MILGVCQAKDSMEYFPRADWVLGLGCKKLLPNSYLLIYLKHGFGTSRLLLFIRIFLSKSQTFKNTTNLSNYLS